jgi:hypothetical protein
MVRGITARRRNNCEKTEIPVTLEKESITYVGHP